MHIGEGTEDDALVEVRCVRVRSVRVDQPHAPLLPRHDDVLQSVAVGVDDERAEAGLDGEPGVVLARVDRLRDPLLGADWPSAT